MEMVDEMIDLIKGLAGDRLIILLSKEDFLLPTHVFEEALRFCRWEH